jgi:hypothetical protein
MVSKLKAMDNDVKDILETVNFIKEHMLTKDEGATREDVRSIVGASIEEHVPAIVRAETNDIRSELKEMHSDLEAVQSHVGNLSGFTKEIDHALARIAAIEKHLGIEHTIAD